MIDLWSIYSREPRKHKTRGDSVDDDEETGAGIITETVGSYTDESGNKVRWQSLFF